MNRRYMADPKTQIEQRVERLELAVSTMASWLVQAQTGFGVGDAEGINRILRGEKPDDNTTNAAAEDSTEAATP